MFIYLVGFGHSYNIWTIGGKRDVDEGRLCLGGLQLPPKRQAQGIDADAQPVRYAASSLGRYVFGSEISYNKAPPRLPGLAC